MDDTGHISEEALKLRLRRLGYEWILTKPISHSSSYGIHVYRHKTIKDVYVVLGPPHGFTPGYGGDEKRKRTSFYEIGYAQNLLEIARNLRTPPEGYDSDAGTAINLRKPESRSLTEENPTLQPSPGTKSLSTKYASIPAWLAIPCTALERTQTISVSTPLPGSREDIGGALHSLFVHLQPTEWRTNEFNVADFLSSLEDDGIKVDIRKVDTVQEALASLFPQGLPEEERDYFLEAMLVALRDRHASIGVQNPLIDLDPETLDKLGATGLVVACLSVANTPIEFAALIVGVGAGIMFIGFSIGVSDGFKEGIGKGLGQHLPQQIKKVLDILGDRSVRHLSHPKKTEKPEKEPDQ